MAGQLFTHYFLTEGIRATSDWHSLISQSDSFEAFRGGVRQRYEDLSHAQDPNEAQTEQDLIRPVLDLLGWTDYLPQQATTGHEDIPDQLLFLDAASRARAAATSNAKDRFRFAAVIEESKRLGVPLDTRGKDGTGTPQGQILRYLSSADSVTDGRIRWGILTNGGVWRLYDYRARPRASGYFEADLAKLLRTGTEHDLRVFYLLFCRDSFTLTDGATVTFLEQALAEGKRYEEQVAQDLSGVVFEKAFPRLVGALANATGATLPEVRQAALIFLYRLLFLLYAEDRDLLPVNDSRYDDYGLRKGVRDDIDRRMSDGDVFSSAATHYYDRLMQLFRLVDKGDPSIGLPPYNGGLFAPESAPLLEQARLPDAAVAPILYELSHTREHDGAGRRFVNYRDMSVQQLGSLYERLLEREPVRDGDGKILIRPNPYARKDSGSFFTPQELVDLIVDRTLKPLVEERLRKFEKKAAQLKSDRRPKDQRKAELIKLDPAEAVLNLKVLDPAMGSGHFLVTAVDFLSDYVAELIEYVPAVPEWLEGGYVSPLAKRVEAVRREILQRAQASNWVLDEAQLTDQAIILRMVLKRCIYGVDKNPLTVELAKVSLWLHSFTVGAPLSFLDHHLRSGDSLLGFRVSEAVNELYRLSRLFSSSAIAGAEVAADGMLRIEEMSDADVAEVQESVRLFKGVDDTTSALRGLLDFFCALHWLTAGMSNRDRTAFEAPLVETVGWYSTDAYRLLAKGPESITTEIPPNLQSSWAGFQSLWKDARSLAQREGFLHWEAAFPGVWHNWQSVRPEGGFDAVIGNPPWDRIKLQEVEWLKTRDSELALAPTAAARRSGIQRLREQGNPLADDFDAAKQRADTLSRLFRGSGHYPLLGRGDINSYSLFVERAMDLIKPDGFVGLLTQSGIYADKTAVRFFQTMSTSGRLAGLFDFENRRPNTGLPPFFPDVDSRQKFCAMIIGGEKRHFNETACAFFLHDTKTLSDPDRCFPLSSSDFARVNPNTGTAPVFRNRRDAGIVRAIYERHPVLVNRSGSGERKAWPVKYMNMFHMTNDSHQFRTAAQLDAEGFYPVQSNRWKRSEELYLQLYEGKMVQAYDHRAASVVVNPANLNRPAQPREATEEEHANPDWLPCPQFWVSVDASAWPEGLGWAVVFKHVTAVTNVRTMIACIAPSAGFGNSLPVFFPAKDTPPKLQAYKETSYTIVANLNAFACDFVMRQKVQGQNLNWFIVEQLPVIAPADYDRRFGHSTARDLVRDHVLRLTYTAHDMAPFARDLGYHGPPFVWNQEKRRHLRARLDALYFHLYGLSREDASYVLDTFPIVRREDEAKFGNYLTKKMILAYMNALAAGDTDTVVAI